MAQACDLVVLGAGSGGLAAAQRAAAHGARVVLLDPAAPGGTCVHRGCVPKKALWAAAGLARAQQLARDYGFALTPGALDWEQFRLARQRYVDGITGRYELRLAEAGIRCVRRRGRLLAADCVEDEDGHRWRASHVVVATGARPRRLALPGFELGLVSDDLFALHGLPRRLAIVGGGYVASEFAGMLQALGVQVTLLVRDRLLPAFDADLTEALGNWLVRDGVRLRRGVDVVAATRGADGLHLDSADGGRHGPFDAVLWAVGRVPNSEDLGLEALGVTRDRNGHVCTDARLDTSVPGVHAVGDVTDRRALTPVAIAAGRCLADRLFGGRPDARFDDRFAPSVVFCEPPLASIGLHEAAARERHGDAVRCYGNCFTPLPLAVAGRSERCMVKLVCAGEDERVVGLHALGPGADEILQGFAVAIGMGARKRDLDGTLAIHPTFAEELVLLG